MNLDDVISVLDSKIEQMNIENLNSVVLGINGLDLFFDSYRFFNQSSVILLIHKDTVVCVINLKNIEFIG